MTSLAVALVLLSALAHATWNLLLKRASDQQVFSWWMLVSVGVLLLPLSAVVLWRDPVVYPGWWFILGTGLIHVLYFTFLGHGYANADLSLVYPISRGMGPALVPALGVLVLGETVSPQAIAGIVAVVVGIYVMHWWGRLGETIRRPLSLFREPGTIYGLLVGLVIAGYSVWDKAGVRYVNPLLYMYFLSVGAAAGLTPSLLLTKGPRRMLSELRANALSILAAGLLAFLAYALVLTALRFSRVSYVAPFREVGIVAGVLMGVLVLKETFGVGRLVGSLIVVAGLFLIALSP